MRIIFALSLAVTLAGCETVDEAFSDLDVVINGGCERLSRVFDNEGLLKEGGRAAIDRIGYDADILKSYRLRYCALAAS